MPDEQNIIDGRYKQLHSILICSYGHIFNYGFEQKTIHKYIKINKNFSNVYLLSKLYGINSMIKWKRTYVVYTLISWKGQYKAKSIYINKIL